MNETPNFVLVERALQLLGSRERVVIGITGCPGAGKSTAAQTLVAELSRTVGATSVPMDGYHLASDELVRRGRVEARGAIDTFDAYGYLAALRRLRTETTHTVYFPTFSRALNAAIGSAIPVDPAARVIVTEGNYLLDEDEPWNLIRAQLDEVWYCDVDEDLRRARLIDRHVRFGKTPEQASCWVHSVDDVNAKRITLTRSRADLIFGTP